MSVYHKFDDTDIIHYSLSTSPRSTFASGTAGWRGSTGTSGSISMYGGIRSKETTDTELTIQPIYHLDTHSIDGKIQLSASYPFTGSLSYVQVVNRELNRSTEVHDSLWGDEHFQPIMNLYEYYSQTNAEYSTSSYDYLALYSEPASTNKVVHSGSYSTISSSFTVEAMIKPLSRSGSLENYTIMNRAGLWSLFITGSDGRLAFSASDGSGLILTSSTSVTVDRWQHVAYSVGSSTGGFTINMEDAGEHPVTGSIDSGSSPINLCFDEYNQSHSLHGFMFESKVWDVKRTFAQMSSSFDRTFVQSGSNNLLLYARLSDGSHSTHHGNAKGSGSFDYSNAASHGLLVNFNTRQAPIWHPNDNANFITPKTSRRNIIDEMRVIHVPSMFYGRSIATGSVKLVCNSYLSSSLQRVLLDDGRGSLYLSGSATSSSLDTREEYQGVKWNRVGNVFYSEGLITITDPSLLDFGAVNTVSPWPEDLLQVSFAGLNVIPTKVLMCRVNGADANCSHNSSYSARNTDTGKLEINQDKPVTWITSVGIYNKDRKLVAVAKLASPIRNREKDKLNIRLKMDF